MMRNLFNHFLLCKLSFVISIWLCPILAKAQVTPDGTTSTIVNREGNNFTIEQGDRINSNLFHSFENFSVPSFGSAVFNNANDIANIFSRVTGGNISNIDGLIEAQGSANLFLLNPNGIIFGENASLNLGGSFFATTADSILFGEDTEFSANNPQAAPLLTVNIPIGFSFRDNPEDITLRNNTLLSIPTGEGITFLGGNLIFDGADFLVPGLDVQIGGLVEEGTVFLAEDGSLNFSPNIAQANISFRNDSQVFVSSSGGGSLEINGESLEITDGSAFVAGIAPDSNNLEAQAGDVNININGELALSDRSFIFNAVQENAIGNAGNINITTNSLKIDNNSAISTTILGNGDSGKITIVANDISLNGEGSLIIGGVGENGVGNAGDIELSTNSLSLSSGTINNSTLGEGNAGAIEIEAQEFFLDASDLLASVRTNATGNGGNINLTASSLTAINQTTSNNGTFGKGDAGSIKINANNILFDNSILINGVGENAQGNGGNIEITTGSFELIKGSRIDSSTIGEGNAGNILIEVEENIRLAGVRNSESTGLGLTFDSAPSTITSQIGIGARGNGGDINISASSLNIEDGASIATTNTGDGVGGDINFDISGDILLQGIAPVKFNSLDFNFPSSIQTATGAGLLFAEEFGGQAGNININSNSLIMRDNSIITSLTQANQNAGNIDIDTENIVSIDNSSIGSSILPGGEGDAGNIDIDTQTLSLTAGGRIDSQVNGALFNLPGGIGEGGNIRINASKSVNIIGFRPEQPPIINPINPLQTQLRGLDSSGILVSTQAGAVGQAGTITVNTSELNLVDSGLIEAITTNFSDAGDIEVNVDTLNAIDGGQIIATTFSQGKAGNIIINSDNEIILSGSDPTFAQRLAQRPDVISNQGADSGIFANTTIGSTGTGGSIFVSNPQQLTIEEGAKISVNSLGQGNGGNLSVRADSAFLNQGELSASTESKEGGNINLQINDDLLLRKDSTISAQAANDANGGNVTIDTELVIAFSDGNNDIIANAERGNGGNINIAAESLFGIEERNLNPFANDINASSEFGLQGNIAINSPEIDPENGLIELPQVVGDPSDQISQNPCEQGVGSEFFDTGKGGLPPNPNEPLSSHRETEVELIKPVSSAENNIVEVDHNQPESKAFPAKGWKFNDRGRVILTSYSTENTQTNKPSTQINQSLCSGN